MKMSASATIGQLVAENPGRSRTFERLGIDYCCGGKRTLNVACMELGLDPEKVCAELQEPGRSDTECAKDWPHLSLAELTAHIELVHHGYLRRELPRLATLIEKVAKVHGDLHPELHELKTVFGKFKDELEFHMQKEERILFPYCRQLDTAKSRPALHCGSVRHPVDAMEAEHNDAGEAMRKFRALTRDYTPPEGACGSYRAMLAGLADLELNMHQHVHEENNILFPRAIAMEEAFGAV